MELTQALRIARQAIHDSGNVMLNRREGRMYPAPGADDNAHDRAEAYNVLKRHEAALENCGK